MLYSNPVPIIPRNLKTSRVYLMAATSRRLKKVCNKASLSNTSYSMEHTKRIDVYVDWFVFVLVQLWGPVDPVSISYKEMHHEAPSSHRVSPIDSLPRIVAKDCVAQADFLKHSARIQPLSHGLAKRGDEAHRKVQFETHRLAAANDQQDPNARR